MSKIGVLQQSLFNEAIKNIQMKINASLDYWGENPSINLFNLLKRINTTKKNHHRKSRFLY